MNNKEYDLISVIIPIYNIEKYVERCIKSIINQTYSNLEIILVDDGSSDSSPEICDKFANIDSRIIVIHKKNGGLSDARNNGLKIAKGNYISFIDGDDYIKPFMYEVLIKNIKNCKADIAMCGFEYVDEDDNVIETDTLQLKDCIINSEQALEKLSDNYEVNYIVTWNKLYSSKCLENVKFPIGKINEDEFVMHTIYYNAKSIVCCNEKYYQYVQHNGSIMSGKIKTKRLDAIEAFSNRYNFYAENSLNQLLYGVVRKLEGNYVFLRSHIYKCFSNKKDKKRITEIDKIFRDIYFKQYGKHGLKSYIKAYCPHLFFYGKRVVTLVNLLLYAIKIHISKIAFLDTPMHENLGDQAIAMAERQFLKTHEISRCEVNANVLDHKERWYAKVTPRNQCILVHGGGFLGTLWIDEEERFRRIIKAFKNHKIIVFPQTITFDLNSEAGRSYLKQSQKIYSSHPDLTIFVREHQSYEFMKKYFPDVKCILVPDIVTIFNINLKRQNRDGILLCLRSDLEKSITNSEVLKIEQELRNKYPNEKLEYTDTVVSYNIPAFYRKREVNKKLMQFSKAELIITDRLHGMVFAALTGSPCIALGNINGKVKNVYEWIKHNEYIKFVDDMEEFADTIKNLDVEKQYTYDRVPVEKNFRALVDLIKHEIK